MQTTPYSSELGLHKRIIPPFQPFRDELSPYLQHMSWNRPSPTPLMGPINLQTTRSQYINLIEFICRTFPPPLPGFVTIHPAAFIAASKPFRRTVHAVKLLSLWPKSSEDIMLILRQSSDESRWLVGFRIKV